MNRLTNSYLYRNKLGLTFTEELIPKTPHHSLAIAYRCNICRKLFKSKNGANQHKCIIIQLQLLQEKTKTRHKRAFEAILRFIATSNLPFRSADNTFLNRALSILDPTFQLPSKDKMRCEMINLSQRILNEMFISIRKQKVSLLLDTCKRWGNTYQGIIIYTYGRLYMWSAFPTPNSKSKTLAELVSSLITQLVNNKTEVVSICTDNAINNKTAFDGGEKSAQQLSGIFFIRVPCSAHTADLAIHDMFMNDKPYHFVIENINILLSNIPKGCYRKGFKPKLKTIRWDSLYKCVTFICNHIEQFKASHLEIVTDGIKTIESKVGWCNLKNMLEIMWNFIQQVEKDHVCIADIVPHYFKAYNDLLSMDNPTAHKLAVHLKRRFHKTCPLQLPMFAYMLTKDGLTYYRNNKDEQKKILTASRKGIIGYMTELKSENKLIKANIRYFKKYLKTFEINNFDQYNIAIEMWNDFSFQNKNCSIPFSFFNIATNVLCIPSSEAAVERLFSSLSKVASSQMCNISPVTLNARLIVKFDSIFQNAGPIKWEDLAKPEQSLKLNEYPCLGYE